MDSLTTPKKRSKEPAVDAVWRRRSIGKSKCQVSGRYGQDDDDDDDEEEDDDEDDSYLYFACQHLHSEQVLTWRPPFALPSPSPTLGCVWHEYSLYAELN